MTSKAYTGNDCDDVLRYHLAQLERYVEYILNKKSYIKHLCKPMIVNSPLYMSLKSIQIFLC